MWTRQQLKTNAKMNFTKNYWPCVGVSFIVALAEGAGTVSSTANNVKSSIETNFHVNSAGVAAGYSAEGLPDSFATGLFSTVMLSVILAMFVIGLVVNIFVVSVIRVGAIGFFVRNQTGMPGIGDIFRGFKSGHYGNIVVTMFLMNLYITLWSLLFLIPGIIKMYEYLMVPYILADNPGMDRKEAFAISKRMMTGEKWNAFILQLSFLGWIFLSMFTCGLLGIFYVSPYMEATMAELYAYNKGKAFHEGYIQ